MKVGFDHLQQTVALAPNFGLSYNYRSLLLQSSGRRSLCNCRQSTADIQGCKSARVKDSELF